MIRLCQDGLITNLSFDMEQLYIKIHDAEIVDGKIIINKIVILNNNDVILREATVNDKLIDLLKAVYINTDYSRAIKLFKDTFDMPITQMIQ